MRPKGKLFALLAIFVAIGLVTATGAFTSVQATRTASVEVAGDSAALLQLQPHTGANGDGAYARLNNGELEINLAGFDSTVPGSGPNLNATTDVQGVFNITNQGSQEVTVNISDTGDHDGIVTFYNASGAYGDAYNAGGLEEDDTPAGTAATLGVGDTVVVSIYVDTTGTPALSPDTQLITEITITAEATA